MTRLPPLLLTLCSLGLPGCKSQAAASEPKRLAADAPTEEAVRDPILEKVRTAIAAKDFAGLSAMEEDFRSSRARTPSGLWKLAAFHSGVQFYLADGLKRESGCAYRQQEFVRQWASAAPRSPAPAITDAALLKAQAWCIRGTGYAASVPAEAWPKFRNLIAAASATLETHKANASIDPEFYAVEVELARSEGASKAEFRSLLDEATGREPDYHRTYFNAAWYYLPQWGGSYAEVESFARYAVERSKASERSGLYARIFWSLEECGCGLMEKSADWPTLKLAMRDVYDQYPSIWNGAYFADTSCRMKDTDGGRGYIRAIHPEAKDDTSFAALFFACDKMAQSES